MSAAFQFQRLIAEFS